MYSTLIKSGSISFLLSLFFLPCIGQVIQSGRFEVTLESFGFENPRVNSLGEDGALIYTRIRDNTNDLLNVIKIDTSLNENWRGAIPIGKNLAVSKVVSKDHTVYVLLNSVGYGGYDFQILALDAQSRNYKSYVVKNLIPLKPSEFKVSNNALLIGGYFNDIPVVLHFNLITGQSRLLPGFFNDAGVLNQIKVYDDGLIDIIVSMKNLQRKKVLWLRSYSPEGDLINSTVLQDADKHLMLGKSLRRPDGAQIVAGSFSTRNSEYSKGVFFSEINSKGEYTIRYYNFSDLENYFIYMKPSREARVKERIERRKTKGKKVRYSYLFQTHELHQYGDDYLLLGEAFYPRYYYVNAYGYSMRGGDRIFDGYRYTHASVIGFNSGGDLLWDNGLEINDIKTFNLIQYVKLAPRGEKLGLVYLFDNELRSKIIDHDQVVEGKSRQPLSLKHDSEVVKDRNTQSSFLEYWYTPYFIAYGTQYVSNSRNEKDNTGRMVLFINKLKFQ